MSSSELTERVAAAPISWGVCEVPGWGHQLEPDQVLAGMESLGFNYTELGPTGFLPPDSKQLRAKLDEYDLKLLGGFVPFVLHDPAQYDEAKDQALAAVKLLADCGAEFFVSCAVSDLDDWQRPELDHREWKHLYGALDELQLMAEDHGLVQAFHPHVSTIVENAYEVEAVLENTSATITLDTAHMALGGVDLLGLTSDYLNRVALVHLKDVADDLAVQYELGEVTFMEAVQQGLFPPLGQGGVGIGEIVRDLEASGKDFWYTLEQDASLVSDDGQVLASLRDDMADSLKFLGELSLK